MGHKVTMQAIAQSLGITKVSVSKALNGQPGVSNELRSRIIATANTMGYYKPAQIEHKEEFVIACIIPKKFFVETDKFYNVIYYYLNRKCISSGYQLFSVVINDEEEKSPSVTSPLSNRKIDGIIMLGEVSSSCVSHFKELSLPILAVDFYKTDIEIESIITDNFFLGYKATEFLIKNGHKKIGFVGDPAQTTSILDRYFGYLKSLYSHGLKSCDEFNICNNDVYGTYTLDISLPEDMPTAMVCHCDAAAYYLIQKLTSMGLKVPDDVSVISFDNTDISTISSPQITTFDINKKQIAYTALDEIALKIKNKMSNTKMISGKRYVSSTFMERDTVKKID